MTSGAAAAAAGFALSALGLLACGVTPSAVPPPPANSCPAYPCDAYGATNPAACVDGVCVVQPGAGVDGGSSRTADIVLLVSTSIDAHYAPGRTFVVGYDALRAGVDAGPVQNVGTLPVKSDQEKGYYLIPPSVTSNEVHWDLGALPGNVTSLPVHATFQPIAVSTPDGGSLSTDGLPLVPVDALPSEQGGFLGPGRGPTIAYAADDLQFGTYQRIVTPDPPFDQAFGPWIESVTVPGPTDPTVFVVNGYDPTGPAGLPTTTISRDRGSFDGWTAYLRDGEGVVISNVAALHDQSTPVTFAVRRGPPTTLDALYNAQLVVAPPPGSIEPTYLGNIIAEVLAAAKYPTLPVPVAVQGTIHDGAMRPVTADLVFEATGITTVVGGHPGLDRQSFELTRFVSVGPDAAGAFAVVLPPGEYRVDVRPRTGEPAVTMIDLRVPVQFEPFVANVTIGPTQTSTGRVVVADGRPFENAIVDALPVSCAQPAPRTARCMPRPVLATTDSNGFFQLQLDPGGYVFRVEPPPSARLPWVAGARVDVTSTSAGSFGVIAVPAPLSIGMQLVDPAGNPASNALVRAFRVSRGSPVELGRAVTDATGHYEMYVAPPE
jgi:hypothetical protein